MTLTPQISKLEGTLVSWLQKTIKAIQLHAFKNWGYNQDDVEEITVVKFDATVDMIGSFMPNLHSNVYEII